MITHLSIHYPKPEYREALLASMRRVDAAAETQPGLVRIHAWTEIGGDRMLGIAQWESIAAFEAAAPTVFEVVRNDPFDLWEYQRPDVMLLEEA
jgi:Antibiotic biosynthesis monooxygenase